MTLRSDDGQATVEHVGLVAMLAVALLGAWAVAAVGAPSIVNRVLGGMQRSLCVVTGQACVTLAREPCPTLRTSKATSQSATFASVRLGNDRVLFIERHSDGTYAISLVGGQQAGGQAEEGTGNGAKTSAVESDDDLGYHVGRTYTASTPAEARALVDRLRREPLPELSTVVDGVADLAGLERADPQVSSYVLAGTGAAHALGKFGLGGYVDVGAQAQVTGELGVKIAAHQRQITAYLRADASVGMFFNALHNLTLPIERTRDGKTETGKATAMNPAGIRLQQNAVGGGSIALKFGPGPTLLEVEVVGYAGMAGSTGAQREIHVRLDPSDPAVQAAIDAWRRAPMATASYAALGRAAAQSAAIDVRDFTTTDTESKHQHGASIGLGGITFGAQYGSRSKVSTLLDEASRPVGGVWEHRLDCDAG